MIRKLAAITGLALVASANAQLANPGFEDDVTYDGPPFIGSWEGFSSGAPNTGVGNSELGPRSGARHLAMNILGDDNSFTGVFQDVPVVAGSMYTLGGWHAAGTSILDVGVEFRIEWRDAVGEIGRTPNSTTAPTPGAGYQEFSLTAMAPAGAEFARVVYAIQTFGGDGPTNSGSIWVDDMSFVPAPGSLALLGLGGLAMARRRR